MMIMLAAVLLWRLQHEQAWQRLEKPRKIRKSEKYPWKKLEYYGLVAPLARANLHRRNHPKSY